MTVQSCRRLPELRDTWKQRHEEHKDEAEQNPQTQMQTKNESPSETQMETQQQTESQMTEKETKRPVKNNGKKNHTRDLQVFFAVCLTLAAAVLVLVLVANGCVFTGNNSIGLDIDRNAASVIGYSDAVVLFDCDFDLRTSQNQPALHRWNYRFPRLNDAGPAPLVEPMYIPGRLRTASRIFQNLDLTGIIFLSSFSFVLFRFLPFCYLPFLLHRFLYGR